MIQRVTSPQTAPVLPEGVVRKGNGKTPEAGRASETSENVAADEVSKKEESVSLLGRLAQLADDFQRPDQLPDYNAAKASLAQIMRDMGPELGNAYRAQANVKPDTALTLLA